VGRGAAGSGFPAIHAPERPGGREPEILG
jgi:hypothetical protein